MCLCLFQIWKHKGEEFRLHGQWGWRWLSATRPYRRQDYRQCGLRAGPWRIVTCVQGKYQNLICIFYENSNVMELFTFFRRRRTQDELRAIGTVC